MPTQFKNIFAANDLIVHYRLRKDGVYEARFHRQGIHIEVSSKDLTKLKQKFIVWNDYDYRLHALFGRISVARGGESKLLKMGFRGKLKV